MSSGSRLNLTSFDSLADGARAFAEDVSGCLREALDQRGRASLAVSGGRTPEHIFPLLARERLSWDRISVTLADERWVASDHPDSNEGLARRLLMQGPVAAARFVGLKTAAENPHDGREGSEAALSTLDWPLDAIFLGMGEDGHIASLFPGSDDWMDAPGRALAVAASDQRQARMSLTPSAILDSRHIFLIITGPEKRAVYDAALKPGPVGELPVRLILHQDRVPVSVYAVD